MSISAQASTLPCRNTRYSAYLPPLNCRFQVQFIWLLTDHESCTFGEWNIILWISHLHVLCLEVPIHHEAPHEKGFAKVICQQLPGTEDY